jgi:5'-3' exonuclease
MQRTYIVDGNAVGYSAHQSGAQLKAGDQLTGAIFGSIRTMREIMIRHGYAPVIMMWDGRSWRKDVSSDYKANREASADLIAMREAYKSQVPHLRELYTYMGISHISAANMEADDLAAMFSHKLAGKGTIVRLVTRDKDWLQLVRPNASWFDFKTNETVTIKAFEEATGYPTPEHFAQSKALQGDKGDNIAGVGGIGEVKAKELIDRYDTVEAFLNTPSEWIAESKLHKAMRDFHADPARRAKFTENMRLMDLTKTDHFPAPVNLKMTPGDFSPEKFRQKCVELGFHSITNRINDFLQPFKNPEGSPHAIAG